MSDVLPCGHWNKSFDGSKSKCRDCNNDIAPPPKYTGEIGVINDEIARSELYETIYDKKKSS